MVETQWEKAESANGMAWVLVHGMTDETGRDNVKEDPWFGGQVSLPQRSPQVHFEEAAASIEWVASPWWRCLSQKSMQQGVLGE
jgi:hypothetical protein